MNKFSITPLPVCAAAALAASMVSPAHAQDESYSFTSGFSGDGIDYPFSIGPSQSSGDFGISGGNFSPGLGELNRFTYQGANLAFFDSNNILTAPSTLISNDAFWTDPRVFTRTTATGNPFSVSSLSFALNDFDAVDSFGFSVAVASLAQAVPTQLPFQVQFGIGSGDFNSVVGGDTLDLLGNSDGPFDFTVEAGTFQSLGSPFVGREARFEFNVSDLMDLAGFTPDDFFNQEEQGSPELIFTLDTRDIDNNNGISLTQIAIDNVTIDGATPQDPRPELTVISGPTPNGPFNPTVFDLTGNPPNANVVNVPATTQNGPVGLSVSSGPFTDPGDFQVTLFTPGNANVSGLGQVSFGFGPTISALTSAVVAGPDAPIALADEVVLTLTPDAGQAGIAPAVAEIQALVDADVAAALQSAFAAVTETLDVAAAYAMGLPVLLLDGAAAQGNTNDYLANVSANQLLSLEAAGEIVISVGLQGGSIVPSFSSEGEIVGARVSSWVVTNQSGVLAAVTTVPEPTALALLAAAAPIVAGRRRRAK